jgi:DNA-binding transcriptional ArsR family regulator
MATLQTGKLPASARLRFLNAIIKAFGSEVRQQLLAHLLQAGPDGLRPSELATRIDRPIDQVSKHLRVLQHALLVENRVGRDEGGVYSRYAATDLAHDWFLRLQLEQEGRLLPLVA